MKIKVTFSKIVDADSIDEAYDKVTKDIASSTERQGDQYISKGEDMGGFKFEELGEHTGYGEGSVDYDY
ncbi:hypothetical protein OAG19_00380 [Akkermansiaceae bacterium]|nr:hypothetical protein [Akkermansiaceae bacterium]